MCIDTQVRHTAVPHLSTGIQSNQYPTLTTGNVSIVDWYSSTVLVLEVKLPVVVLLAVLDLKWYYS